MDQDILGIETEVRPATPSQQSFAHSVQLALQRYFTQLEGAEPADLYNLVLAEMELPLLKMVMRYTNYNQSKAAKVLGLSRGTLRKKLATYRLNERR
ncbi:MAG: Fis family transcriptional regulator [Gammaproteobacteria bacterium RIFCSPHIGHO2_12_FULL_45_9]|nr:MAG: Fis family transcriptional regulator [Gammaproteobacteria bacterium RIFCSPHIGHO2_12_FULL_45_9]